jgi:hypothetical protein
MAAEARAAAHRMAELVARYKRMAGKAVWCTVGLAVASEGHDASPEAAHIVTAVDVMDAHGRHQGDAGYANATILPGDELIAVDKECAQAPPRLLGAASFIARRPDSNRSGAARVAIEADPPPHKAG